MYGFDVPSDGGDGGDMGDLDAMMESMGNNSSSADDSSKITVDLSC